MEPKPELPELMRSRQRTGADGSLLRPKAVLIGVLGGLVLAAPPPAPAHTIDISRAERAVRIEAEKLGQVDTVECWRHTIGRRRSRHRAICVAWWVHTPTGETCVLFYEVRMAAHPSPRLRVTVLPWCDSR